jgi:hypothetical protein
MKTDIANTNDVITVTAVREIAAVLPRLKKVVIIVKVDRKNRSKDREDKKKKKHKRSSSDS